MLHWITVIGLSPYASINTLWMHLLKRRTFPGKIYLLTPSGDRGEDDAAFVKQWAKHLSEVYDGCPEVTIVPFKDDSWQEFREAILTARAMIGEDPFCVDITPGRKYMSALLMKMGLEQGAEHVYYGQLENTRMYLNQPLLLIPSPFLDLIDFREE